MSNQYFSQSIRILNAELRMNEISFIVISFASSLLLASAAFMA